MLQGSMRSVVALLVLLAVHKAYAAEANCPNSARFNGCRTKGCRQLLVGAGEEPVLICDECGHGFKLVAAGTPYATCECAAGFFGKGNNGVCLRCPEGTQLAPGGAIATSNCLNCPPTTMFSKELMDCVCPAGSFLDRKDQPRGFKHVQCKPCDGKNEYMDADMHAYKTCRKCSFGVPNADHTRCVAPTHPDAARAPQKQSVWSKLSAKKPWGASQKTQPSPQASLFQLPDKEAPRSGDFSARLHNILDKLAHELELKPTAAPNSKSAGPAASSPSQQVKTAEGSSKNAEMASGSLSSQHLTALPNAAGSTAPVTPAVAPATPAASGSAPVNAPAQPTTHAPDAAERSGKAL